MALVLADRVKETTTTTGTGTVTLAGASAGYRSFATVGNGNTTYYTISGQTTSEWEVGIGTYTTVGTTLSRTTVLSSSNAGSLVVFSAGTKDVFVTYPAGRSVNVDAANTVVSVPQLSATSIINSGLTSGRVVYSTTGGLETDSANLTFDGTNLSLAGGTANGVTYLNASKVLTSGTALTFDGSILTNTGVGYYINNANALLRFGNAAATRTGYLQVRSDAFEVWSDQAAVPMVFGTSNAERMRLNSSGNLGIGTTSPGSKLEVVGDIQQPNASYLKGKNSAGTATRLFGLNTVDTLYIGSIDADHSGGTLFVKNGVSQMNLDSSGNLGLGVTASAWVGVKAFQLPGSSAIASSNQYLDINSNAYYGATSQYRYISASGLAAQYLQEAGAHIWKTAPASTGAGNPITFTQAMTLTSAGNLGIGTTSPGARLDVQNANAYVRIKSTSGTYALFDIDSPASNQPIIRFLSNGVEQARIISPVNEAASQLVFTTGDSGVEKMRIDASGNLMVGTIASTGSAANTASVVGGIFKTASGTVSAATATATTIFTCPTLGTGLYLVNVQLGYNDPQYYGAVSLVGVGNTTLRATSLATGTNITITVSGQAIQSTQTSGATQTITWTVTRLS